MEADQEASLSAAFDEHVSVSTGVGPIRRGPRRNDPYVRRTTVAERAANARARNRAVRSSNEPDPATNSAAMVPRLPAAPPTALPEVVTRIDNANANPVRDPNNLVNNGRWADFNDGNAKDSPLQWGRKATRWTSAANADWWTMRMKILDATHKIFVTRENRYFAQPWDHGILTSIYEQDCNSDDVLFAKYLITMHLGCLKLASVNAGGSDARVAMVDCFDLPSLHATVVRLWRYRRAVHRMKSRRESTFAGKQNQDSLDGLVARMIAQDKTLNDNRAEIARDGWPSASNPGAQERLAPPEPPELPLLCGAPPREGKSALCCLASSFAVKLGGTVLFGVAPNKRIPLSEMVSKFTNQLQWTSFSRREEETRASNLAALNALATTPGRDRSLALWAVQQTVRDVYSMLTPLKSTPAEGQERDLKPRSCDEDRRHIPDPFAGVDIAKARTTQQGMEIATAWGRTNQLDALGNPRRPAEVVGVWRRLRADGNAAVPASKTSTEWMKDRYNAAFRLPERTLMGTTDEMNRKSQEVDHTRANGARATHDKVHVFMYSQTVINDVQSAAELADYLWGLRTTAADKQRWVLSIHDEAQFLAKDSRYTGGPGPSISEFTEGWMRPSPVLEGLRRQYALARSLSMLVSATLLPATLETELFGRAQMLGVFREAAMVPYPTRQRATAAQWEAWHNEWDEHLMCSDARAAQAAAVAAGRQPPPALLSTVLTPPRGRHAYVAALPVWVQRGDPDNTQAGAWRTYYGTMEHVEPWNGGVLATSSDYRERFDRDSWGAPGAARFTSPGMFLLDLAHAPVSTLADRLVEKQTQYAALATHTKVTLFTTDGQPVLGRGSEVPIGYARAHGAVVELPSADAVKVLTHVREWLEQPPHEVLGRQRKHIAKVILPMYVLAPIRQQADDGAVIDWVRQSLKYAWLRMHRDFKRDPLTDPEHPHKACRTLKVFRRKYGVVALIYASTFDEEQRMRIALGQAQGLAREDSAVAQRRFRLGGDEARIISVVFDPALQENRLPGIHAPLPATASSVGWVSYEPNDNKRAAECGPGTKPPVDVFKERYGGWIAQGRPIAEGTMVPEAHAYRTEMFLPPGGEDFERIKCVDPNAPESAANPIKFDRYFFDPELSLELLPRLRFAGELSDGQDDPVNDTETPLEDLNGVVLRLNMDAWPDAQTAVQFFHTDKNMCKVMAAGYNMFTAGTTMQSSRVRDVCWALHHPKSGLVGPTDIHWVPRYMSLAGKDDPTADGMYQLIGRTFVDMRGSVEGGPNELPAGWRVSFLGARTVLPAVDLYSKLELRLAQLENISMATLIGHLAQLMRHPAMWLKDPFAISLVLNYRLGVVTRIPGMWAFFRLPRAPNAARTDRNVFEGIPQHEPDSNNVVE